MYRNGTLDREDRLLCEAALAEALAPLARQRTRISPARVRAKVRWGLAGTDGRVRWTGALARVNEVAAAAGVAALIFAFSLGGIADQPGRSANAGGDWLAVPRESVSQGVRNFRGERTIPLRDALDPSAPRPTFWVHHTPSRLDLLSVFR